MKTEQAECSILSDRLQILGQYLDRYLEFRHDDAVRHLDQWKTALDHPLPDQGVGMDSLLREIGEVLIPNASPIPRPGCTSFITTGATSAGALASLAASVAAPQRLGINAFSFLEELSLQWLADLFELGPHMKGIYSSGGSVANLVALGAARQYAFEQTGIDPARNGITRPCRIYATQASHHTIHRAAAVLGLGRNSVVIIESDHMGRMLPDKLEEQLAMDCQQNNILPVAVTANAGTTATGTIDPLDAIGRIAKKYSLWFHIDGAYGLPGILDPQVRGLFDGVEHADSVIVDPHKWLGAPVGIGATFVRDRGLLHRTFTQEESDYLEGSFSELDAKHSLDNMGIPYHDFGVELSAPSRGVVVWALLKEIGKQGLAERVSRHNGMARRLARIANDHPELEVVQEPVLSICCFRYVGRHNSDSNKLNLNDLNRRIHRQLVHNNRVMPSTAMINGVLALRPCFVGARTSGQQVDELVAEVLDIGKRLCRAATTETSNTD